MITPESQNWLLKKDCNIEQVKALLSSEFKVETEYQNNPTVVTLLDDYDWDIWNADKLLLRSGNSYQLFSKERVEKADKVTNGARFWWDLPESALRDTVKPLINLRAFMPVVDV